MSDFTNMQSRLGRFATGRKQSHQVVRFSAAPQNRFSVRFAAWIVRARLPDSDSAAELRSRFKEPLPEVSQAKAICLLMVMRLRRLVEVGTIAGSSAAGVILAGDRDKKDAVAIADIGSVIEA